MLKKLTLKKLFESIFETIVKLSGFISIILVVLIFLFLFKEGISIFKKISLKDFILGEKWHPVSRPPVFGILSLILGSAMVTLGAAIISIPCGIAAAIFIAEISKGKIKEFLKIGIEFLSAIPSVVIGFIGIEILVPIVKKVFNLDTGLTAFTGSIMLSIMAMPTIVSIAEDAITSVPRRYREASLAFGATHWQTIWRVILKASFPGIVAACMLGIGRVMGETMAVMMLTGNAAKIPHSLLDPVRTLTATIAAEMGETVQGSNHYFALFAVGIVLFIIAFIINLIADFFLHKEKL
ncbi:MAG: phosphate ABC transporter permease subunit PstC [bacterium]